MRLSLRATQVFLLVTITASCVYLLTTVHLSDYFPIKTIKVYGANHIQRNDVQTLLMPLVRHGFFSINVDNLRDQLMQHPWAAEILVRRQWPDQIHIMVIEKKPIAYWGKTMSLLSDKGVLFTPKEGVAFQALPIFMGPSGQQMLMLNYFNAMSRLLSPLHVKMVYLELSLYGAWMLKLDNGILIQMGHKDILTRLAHFVKVYPKIIGDRAFSVDSVDLRYPNGMAVLWKK